MTYYSTMDKEIRSKYWFVFCKDSLVLEHHADGTYTIPYSPEPPVETQEWTHVLNISPLDDGTEVRALSIDQPLSKDGGRWEMCGLRQSYYKLPTEFYLKAGKCHELLYWDSNTRYCGCCGAPMAMHTDISKRCTHCGKEVWPQLATAIIVLIHRGNEVLLVHARNFKTDFYGLVAGFVETGETLEEAVHREVMEETGLTIRNLTYWASQPWPYPCGLMVGFYAEYESGDLHLQRSELSKGSWFRYDQLPTIPEKLSLARQLIDNWLKTKPQIKNT